MVQCDVQGRKEEAGNQQRDASAKDDRGAVEGPGVASPEVPERGPGVAAKGSPQPAGEDYQSDDQAESESESDESHPVVFLRWESFRRKGDSVNGSPFFRPRDD